jgi:hypothetical protein
LKKLLVLGGIASFLLLGGAGLLLALFVWPTPYRYQQATIGGKTETVRVNRSTGKPERLTARGWVGMAPATTVVLPTLLSCEEAKARVLKYGNTSSIFGLPPDNCDVSEAKAQYDCNQYRERARSNPITLRIQEPPLGCNVSDLMAMYDRQRRY